MIIEFDSYESALEFFNSTDDARSIISNSPRPGMFTVHFGETPRAPQTLAELYRPVNVWYEREERRDRVAYEDALLRMGVVAVGAELATGLGHVGLAADMFANGFAGVHAKVANPRAHGLEAIFRAGRTAKNARDISQRCRAAAHSMREKMTFDNFLACKYQVRPVPWQMPFTG